MSLRDLISCPGGPVQVPRDQVFQRRIFVGLGAKVPLIVLLLFSVFCMEPVDEVKFFLDRSQPSVALPFTRTESTFLVVLSLAALYGV